MKLKMAHSAHDPASKKSTAFEFLKYIGPGFLVTMGFIDPGNWATNIAAGSTFGFPIIWTVTLGTIFLIVLQHNSAHLGIATGLCLSEASTKYMSPLKSRFVLGTAMLASAATVFAEILGCGIALQMLTGLPIPVGSTLSAGLIVWMLLSNSYRKIEKWIIGFVSLIGVAFVFELCLVQFDVAHVLVSAFVPEIPKGSMLFIIGIIGAVVMPHNLFLHSEIIQSRQIADESDEVKEKWMKNEFKDTIFSMSVGWAINIAIIIIAATVFFANNIVVNELADSANILAPILGQHGALVFALALLLSGIASSVTTGMAGGSIFTGIFGESYDIKDPHTKAGILATVLPAAILVFFVASPLKALIYSQVFLSFQLPITILTLLYLTSSEKVMGKYRNRSALKWLLYAIAGVIIVLNGYLVVTSVFGV